MVVRNPELCSKRDNELIIIDLGLITFFPSLGLYDVVVRNPELCPKVLQMLHQHAIRMGLNNANDSVCPIDVHDLVKEQDDQAIVKVGTFKIVLFIG